MAVVRPALFLYVETETPIRVWTGPKPYSLTSDPVDIVGGPYLNLALSSFPVLDRLVDDQAGEYDLTLSGIDPETIGLLDVPADISGARAHLGQLKFDTNWQPTGAVDWLTDLDAESVTWSLVQEEDGHSASVTLKLGSASTDRQSARLTNWSPIEQAILSPGDLAFEYVPSISIGTTRQYPA